MYSDIGLSKIEKGRVYVFMNVQVRRGVLMLHGGVLIHHAAGHTGRDFADSREVCRSRPLWLLH